MSGNASPARRDDRTLLAILFLVALALRLAGWDWGLVHYRPESLPENVRGTVYTYTPDEREFVACYRALGTSLARVRAADGGAALTPGRAIALVLAGRITIAPEYPTASTPLAPYLIFAASLPVVAARAAIEGVPDSNTIFATAILTGRFLSAILGSLLVLLVYRLLGALGVGRFASLFGAAWTAVLPVGVMNGHSASYNTLVSALEIMTLLAIVRMASGDARLHGNRAGMLAGLALTAKATAGPLLPLLAFASWRHTDGGPAERLVAVFRAQLRAVFVYGGILAYTFLTQNAELWRSLDMYAQNIRGNYGPPASTGVVILNFFDLVMPFCLSWSGALLAALSLPVLAVAAFRDRRVALVGAFTAAWLLLSFANPNNQATRMTTLSLLAVVAGALLLDRFRSRGTAGTVRRVAVALGAIVLVHAAVDSALLVRFYRSEDVRDRASAWVEATIPRGARIGNFYEMIYNYHPRVLYTDYFWEDPKRWIYHENLSLASGTFPVDWIVTSRAELLKHDLHRAPQAEALLASAGFRKVAEWEPDLAIGSYRIPYESERYFSPNLFVSRIEVYRRDTPTASSGEDSASLPAIP